MVIEKNAPVILWRELTDAQSTYRDAVSLIRSNPYYGNVRNESGDCVAAFQLVWLEDTEEFGLLVAERLYGASLESMDTASYPDAIESARTFLYNL